MASCAALRPDLTLHAILARRHLRSALVPRQQTWLPRTRFRGQGSLLRTSSTPDGVPRETAYVAAAACLRRASFPARFGPQSAPRLWRLRAGWLVGSAR